MNDTATQPTTPNTEAPMRFAVEHWEFLHDGVRILFATKAREQLDSTRRAAVGELMPALEAVKTAHADSAETKAAREARDSFNQNNARIDKLKADATRLEAEWKAALSNPSTWAKADTIEAEREKTQTALTRAKDRQPILALNAERLELESAKALRRKLDSALQDFRRKADDEITAALDQLGAVASPALPALFAAFARRPTFADGGQALVNQLAGIPTPGPQQAPAAMATADAE